MPDKREHESHRIRDSLAIQSEDTVKRKCNRCGKEDYCNDMGFNIWWCPACKAKQDEPEVLEEETEDE